jgi:hypothetical protein
MAWPTTTKHQQARYSAGAIQYDAMSLLFLWGRRQDARAPTCLALMSSFLCLQ